MLDVGCEMWDLGLRISDCGLRILKTEITYLTSQISYLTSLADFNPRLVAVDSLLSGNRLRQELPWSASNDLALIEVENLAVETQAVT
jgi:hypothetical protein